MRVQPSLLPRSSPPLQLSERKKGSSARLPSNYPRSVNLTHGRALRWAGLTADWSKRRVRVHGLCCAAFPHGLPLQVAATAMAENKSVKVVKYARRGQWRDLVRTLDKGASVNATDEKRRSALFLAALNGKKKCVKELLKRGADPNQYVHSHV